MNWNDVLQLKASDYDLESQEGTTVYRSPIKKIRKENDLIFFEPRWVAIMSKKKPGVWKKLEKPCDVMVNPDHVELKDIGNGRFMWSTFPGDMFVLFPHSVSRLDPEKVRGLIKEDF